MGTLENIIHSFHKFAEQTSRTLIVNGDDENTKKAIEGISGKEIITFGFSEGCDYYPVDISYDPETKTTFTLMQQKKKIADIALSIPGKHNILNACAACAACLAAGAKPEDLSVICQISTEQGAGLKFWEQKTGLRLQMTMHPIRPN